MIKNALVLFFLFINTFSQAKDIFNGAANTWPKKTPKTFAECLDRLDLILSDSLKNVIRSEDEALFATRFFRCCEYGDNCNCPDHDYGLKMALNLVNNALPDSERVNNTGKKKMFFRSSEPSFSDVSAWFNSKGIFNSDIMLRILFYAYHRALNNIDSAETDPVTIISEYAGYFKPRKYLPLILKPTLTYQANGLAALEDSIYNQYQYDLTTPGDTLLVIIAMPEAGAGKREPKRMGYISVYFKVLKKLPGVNHIKAEVLDIEYENPEGQVHFYDKGTYNSTAYKTGKVFEYRADELIKTTEEASYKEWLKTKDQKD